MSLALRATWQQYKIYHCNVSENNLEDLIKAIHLANSTYIIPWILKKTIWNDWLLSYTNHQTTNSFITITFYPILPPSLLPDFTKLICLVQNYLQQRVVNDTKKNVFYCRSLYVRYLTYLSKLNGSKISKILFDSQMIIFYLNFDRNNKSLNLLNK